MIDKRKLSERGPNPSNPYHIALALGLESLHDHLRLGESCTEGALHVVFEQRGRTEDKDLELEFRRLCDRDNLPFEFVIADKRGNSTGLQLADLVARPLGLRVFRPEQRNRTWETLKGKLRRSPDGDVDGYGLQVYPK